MASVSRPFLLDVNLLLALVWPTHIHHEAAHEWFAENRPAGWATCPLTQMGFVRLSMQPAVVKSAMLFGDAIAALVQSTSMKEHRFWGIETTLTDVHPQISERIAGHHQIADAVLLDLAIRHQGRLATFDKRIAGLLPSGSDIQSSLHVIAV